MRRKYFAGLAMGAAFLSCTVARAQAPTVANSVPSLEDFFRDPQVIDEKLSPEGDFLAIMLGGKGGRVRLVVADTEDPLKMRQIVSYSNADVRDIHWVNDRRLVYSLTDLQAKTSVANGGLFGIDRDGSNERELISPSFRFHRESTGSSIVSKVLPPTDVFFSTVSGNTDDIIVADLEFQRNDRFNVDRIALLRLNTRTQERHPVLDSQPAQITQWLLDQDSEPRIGVSVRDGLRRVYVKASGENDWRLIESKPELAPGLLYPQLVGYNGTLYTKLGQMGVVYQADLKVPTQSDKPILSVNGFDFQGGWEVDNKARKVLGVHFLTDAQGSRWFDPYMAAAQKAIDAALPATINTISCGNCLSSRFLLVAAQSDRQPLRYFLYDPAKGKITADVGAARPWINPSQMGSRDFVRYAARDGLQIPAYINTPSGWHKGERRPLIVLVHGGPWVRDISWEWDAQAQFLATRGYVVIQPIFRGSSGFGFDFFHAGWRQWGLAMQDDLTDAARWAVAQGYADPTRIAIGGASYGGYATLMGLIREPELFRCGFEFAGVTDLVTKHDFSLSDASDETRNYSDVILLGDPDKDRAQLEQASPINAADRLAQPLLMAQGVDDVRVPFKQGTSFRDAVTRTNKNVQWVEYPDEGHGLTKEDDRFDYWKRVEALLDKYLRGPDNALAAH